MDKNKANIELQKRVEKYAAEIARIYDIANKEAAQLMLSTGYDGSNPFTWKDYPETKKRLQAIEKKLCNNIQSTVVNGIKHEWEQGEDVIDGQTAEFFSGVDGGVPKQYRLAHNAVAMQAFLKRKEKGLNLSDRVWNLGKSYEGNLELIASAISESIAKGESAASLSRKIRGYLTEPDKLFRRVRDKHGNLVLSKNAKLYHSGKGTYKSSYKNAMRLARTEINMAYRSSEYERNQDLDFVVGIEVKRSNNVYNCSVCESLKGKYPKDFKFTGWHPQCRCFTTTILADADDFINALNNDTPLDTSKSTIKDVPEGYKGWVADNAERIERAKAKGTLPFFLKDNRKYWKNLTTIEYINLNKIRETRSYAKTFEKNIQKISKSLSVNATPINLKSENRILQKAKSDYNGDIFDVSDIIRTTYTQTEDKLNITLLEIKQSFNVFSYKPQKTNMGYTGHLFKVWAKDGVKAEIQVNTPQMIYAKEKDAKSIIGSKLYNEIQQKSGLECGLGHKYYEQYRTSDDEIYKSLLAEESKEYYRKITSVSL